MKATSRRRVGFYLALAASCGLCGDALSATAQKVPLPRPRPAINTAKQTTAPVAATAPLAPKTAPLPQKRPPANSPGLSSFAQANVGLHGAIFESRAFFKPLARPASGPFAIAPTAATPAADIAAVKRVIEAARKHGISITAYYLMADGKVPKDEVLRDIGAKHGKTAAQVALRWAVQQPDVIALSKTATESRLPENFDIFDFDLSDEEMKAIFALAKKDGRIVNPGHLAPEWDD